MRLWIFRGGGRPAAPLNAVHRTQIAVGACPFVPNAHTALFEPVVIARTLEEPKQFINDGLEVHFFGGNQRKPLGQVKTHLIAKHAARSGAGAVGFLDAMDEDMPHKVFVRGRNDAVGAGGGCHKSWSGVQCLRRDV